MQTHIDPSLLESPKKDRNHGVGAMLRQVRKCAGATQADVAERIGLERTSICNIETGVQALTIEKLHEYASFLGIEVVISLRRKPRSKAVIPTAELVLQPVSVV